MDYESMSAEDLRELAARKEAAEMLAGHIGEAAPRFEILEPQDHDLPFPRQFARTVEFEGRAYTVDMRRFKGRTYMRMLAELSDMGEDAPVSKQLGLFDYVLEPVEEDIKRAVIAKCGYDDFEEYYRTCGGIFEAVNAKN